MEISIGSCHTVLMEDLGLLQVSGKFVSRRGLESSPESKCKCFENCNYW
jgi:hypothetical protein